MYQESLVPLLIKISNPFKFLGKKITKRFLKRSELLRINMSEKKSVQYMCKYTDREPLTLLVGMQTGTATMENSVEIS